MLQRERQRRYMEKKKQEGIDIDNPLKKQKVNKNQVTRNLIKTKRDYNREMKRKSRANLSTQKKAWIRKRDRERKAMKRQSLKKVVSPQVEVAESSGFSSKKTCWNVTSNARATLPSTPKKIAIVIDNLIKRTTPRKRKALEESGVIQAKRSRCVSLDFSTVTRLKSSKTGKSALKTIGKSLVKSSIRILANQLQLNRRTLSKKKSVVRRYKVDRKSIQQFYKREDISRVLPQRRYTTKEGPGYALQVSIQAAHSKYNAEYPSKRVSLGTFAGMRPKNIRKMAACHREFCCCSYCINVRYKLLSLSRVVLDKSKKKVNEEDILGILLCPKPDYERFYKPECINGTCKKCSDNYLDTINQFYSDVPEDKEIYWGRWENKTSKDGRVKKALVTKKGKKDDLLHELVHLDVEKPAQGTTFFQHFHIASWQTQQFFNIKNNLPNDCVLQVLDFAKNREVKHQDEIKSAYFTAEHITIHPIVSYYRGENGTVRETSIIISEDNNHDYHAVNHFQQLVDQHLATQLGKTPRKKNSVHSQYKSKGPFADLAHADVEINRNFFGSEHGKGDCDGETGVFNRAVDRAIIGRKVVINDAHDLFNYAKSNLELDDTFAKRKFFFVENGDISRDRLETEVKTLVNTRKIHQALNTKTKNVLKVRNLSCFCKNCEDGDYSNCLNTAYVQNYITKHIVQEKLLKQHGRQKKVKLENQDKDQIESESATLQDQVEHERAPLKDPVKPEIAPLKDQVEPESAPLTANEHVESVTQQLLRPKTFRGLKSKNILLPSLPQPPTVSLISAGMVIDKNSLKLIPEDIVDLYPSTIYGDGNCLPRVASVFAYGHQKNFVERRARIVLELIKNQDKYLLDEYLQDGNQPMHIAKRYAMYSDNYNGEKLTDCAIRKLFENEVLNIRRGGVYMGIWQIAALANVLSRPVYSVYPTHGGHTVRSDLNRTFHPFNPSALAPVYVMWTNLNGDHLHAINWHPNHFVALLPTFVGESEGLMESNVADNSVLGIIEDFNEVDDDWTADEVLDNSFIGHLLDDLDHDEILSDGNDLSSLLAETNNILDGQMQSPSVETEQRPSIDEIEQQSPSVEAEQQPPSVQLTKLPS
ncbi:VRTN-like protein, partial [Mya arenaria]